MLIIFICSILPVLLVMFVLATVDIIRKSRLKYKCKTCEFEFNGNNIVIEDTWLGIRVKCPKCNSKELEEQ